MDKFNISKDFNLLSIFPNSSFFIILDIILFLADNTFKLLYISISFLNIIFKIFSKLSLSSLLLSNISDVKLLKLILSKIIEYIFELIIVNLFISKGIAEISIFLNSQF